MTGSVEIPGEAVEKAARLLFNAEWREGDWYWEQYPEPNRWQMLARQILEATALPYPAPAGESDRIIICEPRKDCADPHPHRWFCMRGFDLDDNPGMPGICPLEKCERQGANRDR